MSDDDTQSDKGTGSLPEEKKAQNIDEKTEKAMGNTMVRDANEAAERLEKANQEKASLLAREERLLVEKSLGGSAEAGKPPEPKKDSDEDYAKKVMSNELETKSS